MDPAKRDNHRETLRRFLLTELLPILRTEGVWIAPDPAPLLRPEVEAIFREVSNDDRYERQHFSTRTEDGYAVVMLNGVVTSERLSDKGQRLWPDREEASR